MYCPYSIPPEYARLLAVAVMAGLDAVLGGIRASIKTDMVQGVLVIIFGLVYYIAIMDKFDFSKGVRADPTAQVTA